MQLLIEHCCQTAHTIVLGMLMLLKAEHNVGRPIACYIRKHTNRRYYFSIEKLDRCAAKQLHK